MTGSCASPRSTSTVQRASGVDHEARDHAMLEADLAGRCRGRSRPRGCTSGSTGRRRSPWPPSTAGSGSPACTCRNPSGRRDSGTGPRCRRSPRGLRGWRSSCPGSGPAGARRRRCRTGRRRRSARRNAPCQVDDATVRFAQLAFRPARTARNCRSQRRFQEAGAPGPQVRAARRPPANRIVHAVRVTAAAMARPGR